jgi:enediyne biosynthesis protein E4
LFRNELAGANHNWVQITLEGISSNRSAIGAVLRTKVVIGGKSVWLTREVQAHNSFQGQGALRVHFGLGDARRIEELEVRWPNGQKTRHTKLKGNGFYYLKEGGKAKPTEPKDK